VAAILTAVKITQLTESITYVQDSKFSTLITKEKNDWSGLLAQRLTIF